LLGLKLGSNELGSGKNNTSLCQILPSLK